MTPVSDIGLVGLAVMGENLALNMESKGFHVSVFNRTVAGRTGTSTAPIPSKTSSNPSRHPARYS